MNPGLSAVPLIFIIVVTAVKDAIEDYRRTILDIELNNAPVHRLVGWDNVNVEEDNVSAWRRFKKANTRFFGGGWNAVESLWKKDDVAARRKSMYDDPRPSIQTTRSQRNSFMSIREDIQMTPVPSPLPRNKELGPPADVNIAETEDRKSVV